MACWFLLATALDPTVFLPYGVAAVTLVGVATSVLTQLLEAAAKVKFALHQAFDAQLTSKLTKAKEAGKQAAVAKKSAAAVAEKVESEAKIVSAIDAKQAALEKALSK